MATTIRNSVAALRSAVTKRLLATGQLKSGQSVSIKAVIVNKDGKQYRILTIDKGLGTFRLSGNIFLDRTLRPSELQCIRTIPFPVRWQQALARYCVRRGNKPLSENDLIEIVLKSGYRNKRRRFGAVTTVYISSIVSRMNNLLNLMSQPFRIVLTYKRTEGSQSVSYYRFYRITNGDSA